MAQEKNFSYEERFLGRIRVEQFRADGPGAFGGPGARTVIHTECSPTRQGGIGAEKQRQDSRQTCSFRSSAGALPIVARQLNEAGGNRTRAVTRVPAQY